jgi:pimeloyl-ACP methyl ester carboxylesterase
MLPDPWDSAEPHHVLIALHGHGADRWQFPRDPRDECRAFRDVARQFGLILVSPDYRARTSWMGPLAERDLLQLIRELRQRHRIGKLFLGGGSMGGTSALIFAALHPDLVDGVCALNPMANMLEYDHFQDAIAASYGGDKQTRPEEYRRRSPELAPERFTMPLAITTGGRDTSVPPQSALRLAEKVKAFNPDVLVIHRPETGHLTNYTDTAAALEFVVSRVLDEKASR